MDGTRVEYSDGLPFAIVLSPGDPVKKIKGD